MNRHTLSLLVALLITAFAASAAAQARTLVPVVGQEMSMAEFSELVIDQVVLNHPGMGGYWDLSYETVSETTRTLPGDDLFFQRVREYWRADGVCYERSTVTLNRIDTTLTIKTLRAILIVSDKALFELLDLLGEAYEVFLDQMAQVVREYHKSELDPTGSVWDAIGTAIPALQPLIDIANAVDGALDNADTIAAAERISRVLAAIEEAIRALINAHESRILIGTKVVTSYSFATVVLDTASSVRAVECVDWIMEIPEGDVLEFAPERLSDDQGKQAFSAASSRR